ncbi:MAG: M15 family metallopeptidase [Eubacterium sp.]|nr:M15 family metallopeptidase [Eubacterium sp.]
MLLKKEEMYRGSLILVNQEYPVKYQISQENLCPVFSGQPEILMEKESAGMLKKLLQEIREEQEKQGKRKEQGNEEVKRKSTEFSKEAIVGVSGYRTREEQVGIFQDSLKENGRAFTEKYVAFPDHSEHQTGLAMDLAENKPEIDFIRPDFPYEGICQKFRERAAAFGFIERYTEEKQKITGIGAEPWHFRYVGVPHAELMQEKGMALEEYIEWLKQFHITKPLILQNGKEEIRIGYVKSEGEITELEMPEFAEKEIRIGYVKSEGEFTELEIPESMGKSLERKRLESGDTREHHIEISGNNADGFIITDTVVQTDGKEHQHGQGRDEDKTGGTPA